MMQEPMSLAKARIIAKAAIVGRLRYGSQYSPPYRGYEILEALTVLELEGQWDSPTKDDLTKANRQYAALNARYKRLKKSCGKEITETDSE